MKDDRSILINSEIRVISQIKDADVIRASKCTPEPSNDVVIATFQENMKEKNNCERSSLGEEERGGDHA